MYISNFRSVRPPYLVEQSDGLDWLAAAQGRLRGDPERVDTYRRRLGRFGCGPDIINRRGTFLRDFTHRDADQMTIFGDPVGGALDQRQTFLR